MKKIIGLALLVSVITLMTGLTSFAAETEITLSENDEKEILEIVNTVVSEINAEYPPAQQERWGSGDQGNTNTGTHGYIATRGSYIAAYSNTKLGTFLTSTRKNQIAKGSVKPDKEDVGAAFANHFYGPSGTNYLGGSNTAYSNMSSNFNKAVNYYNGGNKDLAMEFLGKAIHFISDINEPHHASNLIAGASRHTQFENYVEARFTNYAIGNMTVSALNQYNLRSMLEIANISAGKARSNVGGAESTSTTSMNTAATAMVGDAQKDAAGLIYRFATKVGII